MRRSIRIAVAAILLASGPAGAVPITVMFGSIADQGAGDDLAFVSFPSFDALTANTGGSSAFSQIDVNPFFNTTGLTFDGSNYILMFESIADQGAGDDLTFVSFPSFDALITNMGGISVFSQIDVNPFFNTTGLIAQVDFNGGDEPPPPPVPLPPAIALFATGLAGLFGAGSLRRRRTAAR